MPQTIHLGQLLNRQRIGGQQLETYHEYYRFTLKKGLYQRAGKNHWPERLDKYESPGIGLNKKILGKTLSDTKRQLIVYNEETDRHRLLLKDKANKYLAKKVYGKQHDGNVIVFPVNAFKTVHVQR